MCLYLVCPYKESTRVQYSRVVGQRQKQQAGRSGKLFVLSLSFLHYQYSKVFCFITAILNQESKHIIAPSACATYEVLCCTELNRWL